jgi:hypothetical protein
VCKLQIFRVSPHVKEDMSTEADKIAAGVKKSRPKAATKQCGFPNCPSEAAAGAKLRLTVLESASLYTAADGGKVSTCKPHRMCVGFNGLSPEHAQGTALFPQCGAPAKVLYLGHSFCESCHNVYLEALCAQLKPRLTTEQIETVRAQVVKDNYKKPDSDPVSVEMANLTAKLDALKAQQAKSKKAQPQAAAAAAKKPTTTPPKPSAKKAEPASEAEEDEEHSEDEAETPVAAAAPSAKPDAFEAEEAAPVKLSKEERAAASIAKPPKTK